MDSAFNPGRVPGLKVWLLSDQAGRYQESGLVTPAVADNDPVGGLINLAGGSALIQATSTKRPLLKHGILGGRSVLRADGTDDYLAGTFNPAGTGLTIITACRTGGAIPSSGIIVGSGGVGGTSGIRWGFGLGSDASFGMGWVGATAGTGLVVGSALSINTPYICSWRTNKAGWVSRRNGVQISAPADGSYPSGTFNLFVLMEDAVSWPFNGDLGALLIYASDIGAAMTQKIEKYLGKRWGVAL